MRFVASLTDLDPPFVMVEGIFYLKHGHTATFKSDVYPTWVSAIKSIEDFAQHNNFDLEWKGIDVSKIKLGEIR